MGSRLTAAPVIRATRWAAPLAWWLVVSTPIPAAADQADMSEDAEARLQRGLAHFATKDYEAAIAQFSEAFDLEPHPQFLYAWAQAERLSGDCPSAVTLYQRFLDTGPDESQTSAAETNKKRCEEALATGPSSPAIAPETPTEGPPPAGPTAAPPAEPAPATPDSTPPANPTSPASRPPAAEATPSAEAPSSWYGDPLGGTLLGLGLVGVGVGIGFLLASSSDVRTASEAEQGEPTETYGQHVSRLDRAQNKRTAGIVFAAAGGAVTAAAVVRYILVGTRDSEASAASGVGMWLGLDGAGASYGAAF